MTGSSRQSLQLEVRELDGELALQLGRERIGFDVKATREGLVISRVDPRGPAARVGIRPGDQLVGAYGQRVQTPEQFSRLCRAVLQEPTIPLVIARGGRAYYVNLEP